MDVNRKKAFPRRRLGCNKGQATANPEVNFASEWSEAAPEDAERWAYLAESVPRIRLKDRYGMDTFLEDIP